jgi:hypothetical protein
MTFYISVFLQFAAARILSGHGNSIQILGRFETHFRATENASEKHTLTYKNDIEQDRQKHFNFSKEIILLTF